ncbi:hypothetical protein JKP88DRAFT_216336 [Tribonema minus]|uniref:Uncharacterized protein n=1 Tax=Tribonema minus TaxID=303371 RepID=A0A835YJJ8_9STRA|nr:hypothetical protein JKP88DRAFT_216336 [Tribonema minus]
MVTLSSKSPPKPTLRKASGATKKLGARKLGAAKLSSGGGSEDLSLGGFEEAAAQAEAAKGSLQMPVASASKLSTGAASAAAGAPAGSLYRSPSESSSTQGTYGGSRYGGGSGAGSRRSSADSTYSASAYATKPDAAAYGGSSAYGASPTPAFDKDKYKNAKGIGSDMLNEQALAMDPEERARRTEMASRFTGATAIGSDAYFGREDGSGRARGGSAADDGLGELSQFVGRLGQSVASELKGVGVAANRLKDATRGILGDFQYR